MKTDVKKYFIIVAAALMLTSGFFLMADAVTAAVESPEKPVENSMHPKLLPLDAEGKPVTPGAGQMSAEKTCGQCHDTQYINNHNIHYSEKVKASCTVCHFKEGKPGDDISKAHLRIQLPTDGNCAQCHGIIQSATDAAPLAIPDDYTETIHYTEGKKSYRLTQNTGVMMSPQNLARSAVNLKDKEYLGFAWDVHARRRLSCTACHFVQNSPRNEDTQSGTLDHLKKDPRKIKPPHEYLKRPDHTLKTADCQHCHDPFVIHKNMPYKKRHMDVLSCQACHVPRIHGPAFKTVDSTVLTAEGRSRVELRGVDDSQSHGQSLNTRYFEGYVPFPFAHKKTSSTTGKAIGDNKNENVVYKISPFNLVTYWTWTSGKTGKPVPADVLKQVYLTDTSSESPSHAPWLVKLLDKNGDNRLEETELVLDTTAKVDAVKAKLKGLGIDEPVISGTIRPYKVNHGIMHEYQMSRNCTACHSGESMLGKEIALARHAPAGVVPTFAGDLFPEIGGEVIVKRDGSVALKRSETLPSHYVFGHSRVESLDRVGLLIFILTLVFIIGHGGMRFIFHRKYPADHGHEKTKNVLMYSFYERLWHWTMAAAVMVLAVTGLEIHYAGSFRLFGLENAVPIHNMLAYIFVINAALSLFYHIATGRIKLFFSFNRKFIQETIVQAYYYAYGIFRRASNPIPKTLDRQLNPLQQLTYVGLLNVLLPFQVITGILMVGVEKWEWVSVKLGGLAYLAPIHNLGSWLFLSFLVAHIYLTTTGHTVFAHIRTMVTGYEEVPESEKENEHAALMDMKILDLVGNLVQQLPRKKKK